MSHERTSHPAPKRPYEIYGLSEHERLNWRLSTERFEEILDDENTNIHTINESSNIMVSSCSSLPAVPELMGEYA